MQKFLKQIIENELNNHKQAKLFFQKLYATVKIIKNVYIYYYNKTPLIYQSEQQAIKQQHTFYSFLHYTKLYVEKNTILKNKQKNAVINGQM